MVIGAKAGIAFLGAGTLALAAASAVQAAPIYSQTFSSTATGVLTGTSPTTDTGGATWQLAGNAGSDWTASGGAPTVTGALSPAAEYLPLTVSSGNIYTLTVTDLAPVAGTTTNWLAVGFFNSTSNEILSTASQGPWMLLRDTGYIQAFAGPGGLGNGQSFNGDNGANAGYGPVSLGGTAKVVLNTEAAAWTASWYYNGTQLGTTYTYTANPTNSLGAGFLTFQNVSGSVRSINVTDATPEPAALSLIGLSAGGLLLMKRRRAS